MNKRVARHIQPVLISLLLLILTVCVYRTSLDCGFVNYDDDLYVLYNDNLAQGLSLNGIKWAFTTVSLCNWHPLTWISLIADYQYAGLLPGQYHLTNLLLHLCNILLLFFVFFKMTGYMWRSAFVAALFAVHPLHVESVAWIAERKDVLSTLFWLLTMLAYAAYAQRPGVWRYVLVLLAFTAGLLSKPMLVSLPFVLLALDYWPLGRWQIRPPKGDRPAVPPRRLILEKIPLFTLAAASCAITIYAQGTSGAVRTFDTFPVGVRAANALVSYVGYLIKMVWPHDLAFFYPHPGTTLPLWQILGSTLLLILLSCAARKSAASRPYIIVGWVWYLVTLIPVIGLVQVGIQAMADRYTYIPLIGIFVILAWAVPDLLFTVCQNLSRQFAATAKASVAVITCIIIVVLAVLAHSQVSVWRNDFSLFSHAVAVTQKNGLAEFSLANTLLQRGEANAAVKHLNEATKYPPNQAEAYNNLGALFQQQGKLDRALVYYRNSVKMDPDCAESRRNLAAALVEKGKPEEAVIHYSAAAKLRPDDPGIQEGLELAQSMVKANR